MIKNANKPSHYCSKRGGDGDSERPYPPVLEHWECTRCLWDQNMELRALLEEVRVSIDTVNRFGRSSIAFGKYLVPLIPKILRVVTNSQEIVEIGGVLTFPEGYNYEGFHEAVKERWDRSDGLSYCRVHDSHFSESEEPCNQCYNEFGGP